MCIYLAVYSLCQICRQPSGQSVLLFFCAHLCMYIFLVSYQRSNRLHHSSLDVSPFRFVANLRSKCQAKLSSWAQYGILTLSSESVKMSVEHKYNMVRNSRFVLVIKLLLSLTNEALRLSAVHERGFKPACKVTLRRISRLNARVITRQSKSLGWVQRNPRTKLKNNVLTSGQRLTMGDFYQRR